CHKKNLHGFTHPRCNRPYALNGLVSSLVYQGLAKKAVKKLKFKFVKDLNHTLVDLAISLGDFSPLEKDHWLVTPVPLHPRRERWRGFNQSHHLAQALA